MQAPVPGRSRGDAPHLGGPGAELGQEDLGGHGHRQLAALHGFRAFVGGFELRVHPLVAEEAGAVLGDAVAAHQADGLAQHVGAVAGIPELGGRANHVGFGVHQHVLHQRIGFQFGAAGIVFLEREQLDGALLALLERLHLGASALDAALLRGWPSSAFRCGSSSSKRRAVAKPSEVAASPVAQTSTRRCSASSRCWMPCS